MGETPAVIEMDGAGVIQYPTDENTTLQARLDFTSLMLNGEDFAGAALLTDGEQVYFYDPASESWQFVPPSTEADPFASLILSLFSPDILLSLPEEFPNATQWTIGDSIILDERPMVVYQFDFQLGTLVTSEQFLNQIMALLTNTNEISGTETPVSGTDSETLNLLLGLITNQISEQLNQGHFQMVLSISPEDHRVYQVQVDVDASIDLGFLQRFLGSQTEASIEPITSRLSLSMVIDDYDTPVLIETPADTIEGANPFTLDLLSGTRPLRNVPTLLDSAEFVLKFDSTFEGRLSEENPKDYFRFSAQAGDVVTITMTSLEKDNLLDPYLKLYDAAGIILAENDDARQNTGIGILDAEIYQFEIPVTGDYLIEATWLFAVPARDYILTIKRE
jgi:hypothetical protein